MTTYVPRGAGRPAASARRLKHSQRTALPASPDLAARAEALLAESAALRARLREDRTWREAAAEAADLDGAR